MIIKILTIMLVVVLVCSVSITGFAADTIRLKVKSPVAEVKLTYIQQVYTSLSISSSGLSNSYAKMNAYPGVDSIRISMYLQRYDNGWKTVKHWAQNFTGTNGSLSKDWYVTRGYNYRALSYFYAYNGPNSDSYNRTHEQSYY